MTERPEHEHIDETLNTIIRNESLRQAYLRSPTARTLAQYHVGDPVWLRLSGVTIGDVQVERSQFIAGYLADPALALVDVTWHDELEELCGQRIGLAVDTTLTTPGGLINATLQKSVGSGEFAYFLPEDLEPYSGGLLAPQEKIRHLGLRYTRMAIGGEDVFDYS